MSNYGYINLKQIQEKAQKYVIVLVMENMEQLKSSKKIKLSKRDA